jgi:hypothetical protein
MKFIIVEELTDEQLRQLQDEAKAFGDRKMDALCELAITGEFTGEGYSLDFQAEGYSQEDAKRECAQAINDALAMCEWPPARHPGKPEKVYALYGRLEELRSEVRKEALAWVEDKARAILQDNPNLKEFVMGMGTWFLTDTEGEILHRIPSYAKEMENKILEFDRMVGILGVPMRFTARGKTVTDW